MSSGIKRATVMIATVMVATIIGLAASAALFGPVMAQTAPGAAGDTAPKSAAQKAAAPAKPAAGAASAGTSAAGSDSGLRQRVEQLEEQIVDMQVVIGTLESLAKAPPPSPSAMPSRAADGGADQARISQLEQQLQSMNGQLQQLANEVRAQRGSGAGAGMTTVTSQPGPAAAAGSTATSSVSSFGSTTITSDQSDAIGGLIASEAAPAKLGEALPDVGTAPAAGGDQYAALPPAEGTDPQQMYSSAYGFLLGQNYGAAQAGFEEFLRRHAKDPLAPDALFWLGEAHYMQKNYADAANAFELVASAYGSSAKAPEALLRRASAFVQLGQKDGACAALRQLNTKYPNARAVLKTKADAERQRAGCA